MTHLYSRSFTENLTLKSTFLLKQKNTLFAFSIPLTLIWSSRLKETRLPSALITMLFKISISVESLAIWPLFKSPLSDTPVTISSTLSSLTRRMLSLIWWTPGYSYRSRIHFSNFFNDLGFPTFEIFKWIKNAGHFSIGGENIAAYTYIAKPYNFWRHKAILLHSFSERHKRLRDTNCCTFRHKLPTSFFTGFFQVGHFGLLVLGIVFNTFNNMKPWFFRCYVKENFWYHKHSEDSD